MKRFNSIVIGMVVVIVLASVITAGVPQLINYQGQLENLSGSPLDTTVSMTFTIYDDSIAGSAMWTEVQPNVTATDGLFNVILGTVSPLSDSVFDGIVRHLGVQVGSDQELVPRTRLVSVGYSHRVSTIDGATGGLISGDMAVRGNVQILSEADGTLIMELGEGLDYAEGFDMVNDNKIESGTVLVIDSETPGKLSIADKPYDSKVAGIVAGGNGLGSGVRLGAGQFDYDVALAGRVYCNVDASEIGVEPGDLLTTSSTPGYAMKAVDRVRAHGAILGKAMERLPKGHRGKVLVLVTLQ